MINLDLIVEALEMTSNETQFFFDREKNDTVMLSLYSDDYSQVSDMIDEDEDDRFIPLPTQYEINEYGMMEEFARPVRTFSGNLLPTLQSEVYNFEDEEQRAAFLEDKDVFVSVPHSDKEVLYCAQRKVAVLVSELGASKAINLGAYNFALNELNK